MHICYVMYLSKVIVASSLILVNIVSLLRCSDVSTNLVQKIKDFDMIDVTTTEFPGMSEEYMENLPSDNNTYITDDLSGEIDDFEKNDVKTILEGISTQNNTNVLPEYKPANYDTYEGNNLQDEIEDYENYDDKTMLGGISHHDKKDIMTPNIPSDYDYYDKNDLHPSSIHSQLSEVVGKRVGAEVADNILETNLKSKTNEYIYDDWKEWVKSDEYQIYCRSNSDCVWIANDLECMSIRARQTTSSWFNNGTTQNMGKCSCPEIFDLGFSWNAQTCIKTQEEWTIIVMSLLFCLIGTILILLLAHVQDILVAFGLRKRSLPTPTNSSIGRYPSVQK